jgi:Bacterial protein of unknown function (DUF885)
MRSRTGLVVLLMALGVPARADDVAALARDFWAWRAGEQPISQDDITRLERPAGWTPDWSAAAVSARRATLDSLEARYHALPGPAPTRAQEVDRRLIGSALARVRFELDVVPGWRRDPGFYVDQSLGAVQDCLLPPPPMDAARVAALLARLRAIPALVEQARANLDDARAPFARLAIAALADARSRLAEMADSLAPLLPPASPPEVRAAAERAGVALESYRSWLEAKLPGLEERTAVGEEAYDFFLKRVALLPYSPQELLAMGRQEWERAVSFEAIEAARDAGAPETPLARDQAEQIARLSRDELAMRRFLVEKHLASVPGWLRHYRYLPLPRYLDVLGDVGEQDDFTSPSRLDEDATRYVPAPGPDLGYFAATMARDPRPHLSHEGIPGHYFQLALSWRNPDEIRRHYYDSTPCEGLAFYDEELMLQAGLYADAPATRRVVYNFMRLRALRVEADVKLALGRFTIAQAGEYLRATVPMDAETARHEAAFFAATPGQAIGYEIGKLQVLRLLADARRVQGESFDLRRFHDFLYANGNLPLALLRYELLGLRDDLDRADARSPSRAQ